MWRRFRSDLDAQDGYGSETDVPLSRSSQQFRVNSRGSGVRRGLEKGTSGIYRLGQSLKLKGAASAQEYDESDPKAGRKAYLDPTSPKLQRWNMFFVTTCLAAVFVDPLFYYLPYVDNQRNCVGISDGLKKSVTVFRTITDFFYIVHMCLQFRTAYIAPSSRVFGRGELVTDPKKIAARYLRKDFWVDLVAVLPVPQVGLCFSNHLLFQIFTSSVSAFHGGSLFWGFVFLSSFAWLWQFMIWVVIPNLTTNTPSIDTKNALRFIVFLQYFPRLFRLFPMTSKIINTTGVLMETAWAGAAFNLLLYMLASHVSRSDLLQS